MQGVKPWQIVLMVVAVIAMTVSIVSSCRGQGLDLSTSIPMVDVFTGDQFVVKAPPSGSMIIPSKHPTTGEYTLIPYAPDEAGVLKVSDFYFSGIAKRTKGKQIAVDPKTLQVTVTDKPIETIISN
jgi:hypothetical protein